MDTKTLYIVVPCYNEEEILNYSSKILVEKLENLVENNRISKNSKILMVDDGSTDSTWNIILTLHKKNPKITGLKLSKNKGHQNALIAGLNIAKNLADMVISLDADLQDDTNAIDEMIDKFYEGFEIVYGVRKSRKKDSFFKKMTAEMFYRLMNFLGAKTIFNHADFRLMSKRALIALSEFEETNIFLRGIVPNLGFKNCCIFYDRDKRKAGTTKYPLSKMVAFAINGITSCSVKMLHLIFIFGVFSLLIGLIKTTIFLFNLILKNNNSPLSGIVSLIWTFGGIILISLGIVGEYVGKIYMETKKRPRYIIERNLTEE